MDFEVNITSEEVGMESRRSVFVSWDSDLYTHGCKDLYTHGCKDTRTGIKIGCKYPKV